VSEKTKIVILGGGFGGFYAALELDRTLARDPDVEVTLVNRENFFLFTPMLHEVAASDLDLTDIVSPIRRVLRRVSFHQGVVERIDLDSRRVVVSHGFERHVHEIPFDHVVLGLGSVTNFHGLPGLEERALTMKSLGDAVRLRNRLIALLEEADPECARGWRDRLMTVVVAGGGFAGVETIGAINDFVRAALPYYRRIPRDAVRMVLVESGPEILPELGPNLGRYAHKKLAGQGIEVRTGTRVKSLDGEGVLLDDGSFLRAATLVWTAGTSPHPLLESLPCPKERGRIRVDPYLEVPGRPGVWALGDCASILDPRTGRPHPPTAQHALREGRVLAANLLRSVRGGRRKEFRFSTLGQLAAIGRRAGVAKILGLRFSGFIAWFLWRTIYLAKLPGFEKKLRVALNWTLDLLFSKDFVEYGTGDTAGGSPAATEPVAAGKDARGVPAGAP
jgi:NADH dehydrogenase